MFFEERNSIIHFLKNGINSAFYVNLNDDISTLEKIYGKPFDIVGTTNFGHYNYSKGVRFSYKKNKIDEIDIKLINYEENISFLLDDKLEVDSININTPIHTFIFLLNQFNILWKSYNEQNKSVFALLTESGVCVVFDLQTGELIKIATNSYLIDYSKKLFSN